MTRDERGRETWNERQRRKTKRVTVREGKGKEKEKKRAEREIWGKPFPSDLRRTHSLNTMMEENSRAVSHCPLPLLRLIYFSLSCVSPFLPFSFSLL